MKTKLEKNTKLGDFSKLVFFFLSEKKEDGMVMLFLLNLLLRATLDSCQADWFS